MRTTTITTAQGTAARFLHSAFAIVATVVPLAGHAVPAAEAPEIELYLAGSTAQDEIIENLMRLNTGIQGAPNVCEPGTLDIYRGQIAGTGKRVYYCRTSGNIAGIAAGRRLSIHKSSGGSGEGVGPVSARTPISYLDLTALPATPSCKDGAEV